MVTSTLFTQQFTAALNNYLSSSAYVTRRIGEAQIQGLGHLSRLFDEITFTPEAGREAYEQSMSTDNIETHVNNSTREAIKTLFNEDLTDLSEEAKKALGPNYDKLLKLCPGHDPKMMIDTLLQAVVTIYGQVIAQGLDAKKHEVADNEELDAKQKSEEQNLLTIAYNEQVSSPMENYCRFLTRDVLLGKVSEQLTPEEMIGKLTQFTSSIFPILSRLNDYQNELYNQLGYPIFLKNKDQTTMEPNTIYLSLVEDASGNKQCVYSIKTPDSQVKEGNLSIPEINITQEEQISDARLKTKKVAILLELVRQDAIPPINNKLANNVLCLQKAKDDIQNQLDKCEASLDKLESIPSSVNVRAAGEHLEKSCQGIIKTVQDNLYHVEQEPHVKSLAEKVLNWIVQFVSRGSMKYESDATKQVEKRAALPDKLESIATTLSMKERLQAITQERSPAAQLEKTDQMSHKI